MQSASRQRIPPDWQHYYVIRNLFKVCLEEDFAFSSLNRAPVRTLLSLSHTHTHIYIYCIKIQWRLCWNRVWDPFHMSTKRFSFLYTVMVVLNPWAGFQRRKPRLLALWMDWPWNWGTKKKKKTRDEDDIETPSGNGQDWLGLEACTIFFCRIHRRLFSSSSSTELSLGAPTSKSIQLKKEIGISWIKVERSPPIFQITRTQFLLFLDHNVF